MTGAATDGFLLRPLKIQDAAPLSVALGDAQTTKLAALSLHSLPAAQTFVRHKLSLQARGKCAPWTVLFDASVIGYGAVELNGSNNTAELVFALCPSARGCGLGNRLCAILIDQARTRFPGYPVTGVCLPQNPGASATLRANGFRPAASHEDGLLCFQLPDTS